MSNVNGGTVVTCRVRLARNLSGYNFGSTLTDRAAAREIINKTYKLISQFGDFKLYEMSKITPEFAQQLKESYVISEDLKNNTFSGAVAVNQTSRLSVMINEEDHIRSQCILPGENLLTAYSRLQPLDRWLNNNLRFCKNQKYGYITACPTNLGTGLRASVMMFLPTLTGTDMMNQLYEKAKPRGLTIRGVFGEGSKGESSLYQISNEVTLGKSETAIIKEVQSYVLEVAEIEQVNALTYYNKNKLLVEDEVFRAVAILKNCKLLSYQEFALHIASIKLGAMLKIIKINSFSALDDLLISCRPAILKNSLMQVQSVDNRPIGGHFSGFLLNGNQKEDGITLNAFRAEYVKNSLNKITL